MPNNKMNEYDEKYTEVFIEKYTGTNYLFVMDNARIHHAKKV